MPSRIRKVRAYNAKQARYFASSYKKLGTAKYYAESIKSVKVVKNAPLMDGRKLYRVEFYRKPLPKSQLKWGYHTHWVTTKKMHKRILHPISRSHRDPNTQWRHDVTTGKYQRWLKENRLLMVDSSRDRYIREVIRRR